MRWWDFFHQPTELHGISPAERRQAYRAALHRHRDRLTGRAALRLAHLLPRFPADHYHREHCVEPVLRSRHVHIDGYGNIFPGVCNGIILGKAAGRTVEDVWHDVARNWQRNPVVEAVVTGGSCELMRRAKARGYRELPKGYADKCHLCAHVRQFLVDRHIWREYLGPPECYANQRDRAEAGNDASPPTGGGEPRT